MFVRTANTLDAIPGRCATAWRSSSSPATPRRRSSRSPSATSCRARSSATGCKKSWISIGDPALRAIIRDYTREAGVRSSSARSARCAARSPAQVAEGDARQRPRRDHASRGCASCSGKPRFHAEVKRRTRQPGVATGLAWTPVGGDVLFVEATAMPRQGPADDHRPARRRHARVGPGGAVLRPRRTRTSRARARPTTGSPSTTSTSTSRRARPEGRPERRHHDGHRARLAAHGPPRARRRRR